MYFRKSWCNTLCNLKYVNCSNYVYAFILSNIEIIYAFILSNIAIVYAFILCPYLQLYVSWLCPLQLLGVFIYGLGTNWVLVGIEFALSWN